MPTLQPVFASGLQRKTDDVVEKTKKCGKGKKVDGGLDSARLAVHHSYSRSTGQRRPSLRLELNAVEARQLQEICRTTAGDGDFQSAPRTNDQEGLSWWGPCVVLEIGLHH